MGLKFASILKFAIGYMAPKIVIRLEDSVVQCKVHKQAVGIFSSGHGSAIKLGVWSQVPA